MQKVRGVQMMDTAKLHRGDTSWFKRVKTDLPVVPISIHEVSVRILAGSRGSNIGVSSKPLTSLT